MSSQERIRICWERASLYGLLSDGYKYTSLEKSAYYGKLHREWMDRLAEQVEAQGAEADEREQLAPSYSPSAAPAPQAGAHPPAAHGGQSWTAGPAYPSQVYPGLTDPAYRPPGIAGPGGGYPSQNYPAYSSTGGGYYGQPSAYGQPGRPAVQWPYATSPIRMEPMTSRLRIIHASPEAGPVDIYINQKLAAPGVAYKDVVPYMNVQAGHYLIDIYPAGKTGHLILSRTLQVQAGQSYTLAAGNKPDELQLYAYLDDPAPTAGQARLRVIHLSPDAPPVDIRTESGAALFNQLAFGQSTAYATAPPGTVDLQVLQTGTEQIVLALPGRELPADSVTTVIAVGLTEAEPPLEALLLSDL
ncbi:DUF4397 domain-containing protein [Paenibacillus sp. 1P07SE]|uniref:DUF4397 domain-containing protein n=1 Tax=Paenibacillus sp. 1P07SE TaxID=3132209 RepID=UPI0039A6B685